MATKAMIYNPGQGSNQYLAVVNGSLGIVDSQKQATTWILDLNTDTCNANTYAGSTFITLFRYQSSDDKTPSFVSGDGGMLQSAGSCPLVMRSDCGFVFQIGALSINDLRPINVVGPAGKYVLSIDNGSVILAKTGVEAWVIDIV